MFILKNFFLFFIKKKQVLIRLILVWLLSTLIFNYDEQNGFDLRFKLRSKQPTADDIVIINIDKKGWDEIISPSFSPILNLTRPLSDSYFWSTPVWREILTNILNSNPKTVLVDLFFDRSIPMRRSIERSFKIPKVNWRAEEDPRFGYKAPRFSISSIKKTSRSERSLLNVGLGTVFKDYDYTARRYRRLKKSFYLKDIPCKLAEAETSKGCQDLNPGDTLYINFRGGQNSYPTIDIQQLLTHSYPQNFFKNKFVLIGSNSMAKHFVKTPLGLLTRTEYNANVLDNILNGLWIKSFYTYVYIAYLLIIVVICFIVLHNLKQTLSLLILILLSVCLTSISIIYFDIYNIWIPIISPLSAIFLSYIILLNHLLSESEYLAWKTLKKEETSKEMNKLKNNFVSLFSHDLKTPLAKIHAISDRLLQSKKSSEIDVQLEAKKIKKETKELDRYIQSILQVTRIEAGEFNLNIVPQDINELIHDCINTIKILAQEKDISIDFQEEPLFSIEMDAKLIKEVFLNLLENSIKYSPNGSKILIAIEEQTEHDHLKIIFKDNGPGIPEQDQEAIFEKFYRSQSGIHNKKGTGLGLYLVRYFIRIHDGEVNIVSSPGEGTSFIITFPYEQKKERS